MNSSTYIIAEMSCNHLGSFDRAKEIIVAAKESGADAIKLQTDTVEYETVDCKNDYFKIDCGTIWDGQYLVDLYRKVLTPWEWHADLKAFADEIGIDLFSTPCAPIAVDFLEKLDVPMYKISAFEAIDIPLIEYAAAKQKPMLISVGISREEEIWEAIEACKKAGNDDITILKCTSSYPAKLEDMNLATIADMKEKFGVKVGLSDHTLCNEASVIAVTLGATVIEKHFTLSRDDGGEDSTFSIEPDELKALVKAVRDTEKLLGCVNYKVNQDNRKFARSLFVIEDMRKGDVFTNDNVRSVRPNDGLLPKYLPDILGKKATCDLERGTPMKMEFFE